MAVHAILLIVAQVLVAMDRGIPLQKRVATGLATFAAVLLDVKSGTTYYYVTRAVDANGRESVNSTETIAMIP